MYKNWTSLPSPLGFFCYRACFLSFILGYLFSTHHVQLWVNVSYCILSSTDACDVQLLTLSSARATWPRDTPRDTSTPYSVSAINKRCTAWCNHKNIAVSCIERFMWIIRCILYLAWSSHCRRHLSASDAGVGLNCSVAMSSTRFSYRSACQRRESRGRDNSSTFSRNKWLSSEWRRWK